MVDLIQFADVRDGFQQRGQRPGDSLPEANPDLSQQGVAIALQLALALRVQRDPLRLR